MSENGEKEFNSGIFQLKQCYQWYLNRVLHLDSAEHRQQTMKWMVNNIFNDANSRAVLGAIHLKPSNDTKPDKNQVLELYLSKSQQHQ